MKKQKVLIYKTHEEVKKLLEDGNHIDGMVNFEGGFMVVYTPKTEPIQVNPGLREELNKIVEKWNKVELPNKYKQKDWQQLKKVRKITPAMINNYKNIRNNFEYVEVIQSITNYLQDIVERTSTSQEEKQGIPHKKRYYNHRFKLDVFIGQKNGLQKFINN